jgi:hypothetical protein
MEGYEVIGSDGGKLGHVVALEGDLLVIEEGHLRKTRYAIPKAFAHPDEQDEVVRLTVSKELVEDSPPLKNGDLDRKAVAAHYGLAEGFDDPATEGYGEVTPDDPAWGAEQEQLRTGVEPAPKQRAESREGQETGVRGRQIIPPDSHDPL